MNYQKGISLGVALSLILGTSASALTPQEMLQQNKEKLMVLESQIAQESELQKLNDDDSVRVIVEIEGESVIDKAIAKDVKVSDMDTKEIEKEQKGIMKQQEKVQDKIEDEGIEYEVKNSFTTVVNGFSMDTTLGQAKEIEGVDGVKSVTIANEYEKPVLEPDMAHSGEITETQEAWSNGFKGEGTVIAIIDSGVDTTHKDLKLTDPSKVKISKEDAEKTIKDKKLEGEYFTSKVPYGHNYMDGDNETRDLCTDSTQHGMHVAGIAAANGDKIKGTAPEAQVLAMKVFGNNNGYSSTYSDIIIKAIDDSTILGADVMNLSLGSTSSIVDDADPEQAAVNKASENGILMSISAGNSYYYGYGHSKPFAANPDYGVVGAPGLATKSLQVASIENTMVTGKRVEFTLGEEKHEVRYTTSGPDVVATQPDKELKVVDCGIGGSAKDFPAEVEGNVALVKRGECNFVDKMINASNAGAAVIIVYNNKKEDELTNMAYPEDGTTIPGLFISQEDGELIKAHCKDENFKVKFTTKTHEVANPQKGEMSGFSSWGVTSELEFKPEITGVGGNVWSLANDNSYKNMSGTSMAAPNVSGGSAVVAERVGKLFNYTGEAKSLMVKNLLMSTADPRKEDEVYTSPRRQGAGVMKLSSATSTNAIVTESTTGVSKVNLKEIKGDKATFTMKVTNFGKEDIEYNVRGTVQTDDVEKNKDGVVISSLTPQKILNKAGDAMPITFSTDKVKVPAGGEAEVTATVDLKDAQLQSGGAIKDTFVNGAFVEGFIFLEDVKDKEAALSIPYMGFDGVWGNVPNLDTSIYEKEGHSFYGMQSMGVVSGEDINLMGNAEFMDFSPNGNGMNDSIIPVISALRNMSEFEVDILNSEGNILKTLTHKDGVIKNYYQNGAGKKYSLYGDTEWDGKVDGQVQEDGTYTYRIKSKVGFEGADWQTVDYKVNLDTQAPTINDIKYDGDKKILTVVAEDNLKGHISAYGLFKGDKLVDKNTNGIFDLGKLGVDFKDCEVLVMDHAGNAVTKNVGEPTGAVEGDITAPGLVITSPKFGEKISSNEVTVTGTVKDQSHIDEFTIAGVDVPLTYVGNNTWKFEHTMTVEEGLNTIYVLAKDAAGNKMGTGQKVYIDLTNPVIEAEDIQSVTTKDSINIKAHITDNFPGLKVSINGDVVKNIEFDSQNYENLGKPTGKYDLDTNYKLSTGENIINLEVEDAFGLKATKTMKIEKVDKMDTASKKLAGDNRYETAVKVSEEGWKTSGCAILVNGTAYADALVAAPLATVHEAPILLTEKDQLPEVTAKELQRLGVSKVIVIGGTNVISNEVATQVANSGMQMVRIAGNNRYETSLLIAKYVDRFKDVENIYVAGGMAPADAVTISSKAAIDGNPIVLVEKNDVAATTLEWLKAEEIENAYVIGGTTVVSDAVANKFTEITKDNTKAIRVAGENRYETNAAVVDTFFGNYSENVVATEGLKLIDALVVSQYTAKTGAPIVITSDSLVDGQKATMDRMISKNVVQVGGQVSEDVIKDMTTRLNVEK